MGWVMLKKLVICSLLSAISAMSWANIETLKRNLNQHYPNLEISNIQATAMSDLYSAKLDDQLIYLDEQAEYMFIGSMIRLKDQKNLTKDLALQQNSVNWKQLPLEDAIKTVKGTGEHQLVVFSDPNCPYCKQLESELEQLHDVTIYTFIYPLKSQSIAISRQVWCAQNQQLAWKNLIQKGQAPQNQTCPNPIDRNLVLGQKLKLAGTPTLIFANGLKLTGLRSAKDIQMIWKKSEL